MTHNAVWHNLPACQSLEQSTPGPMHLVLHRKLLPFPQQCRRGRCETQTKKGRIKHHSTDTRVRIHKNNLEWFSIRTNYTTDGDLKRMQQTRASSSRLMNDSFIYFSFPSLNSSTFSFKIWPKDAWETILMDALYPTPPFFTPTLTAWCDGNVASLPFSRL